MLLAIFILIGINGWKEELPINNGNGGNNQIIAGSNNSAADAGQSNDANKILSAVPKELRSSFFLEEKENRCCKTLLGNVAVAVVMVNDSASQWDDKATAELRTALQDNGREVIADAKAYGADLSLTFHYYTANITGDVGTDGEKDWQDQALESAGLPSVSKVHKYLTKQHSAKEAPLMFVLNKSGRATTSVTDVEWITMFHKSGYDGFEHELLHIFGAKDFYYPKEVKQWAVKYFPDSIMNTDGEEVDSLTAYLVGWTDTLADNALAFLKDSSRITESYMQEQNAKELFTGVGTKEYDNGTYTGDLLRGFRHGTGTMRYHNGGWYTGQWNNGQRSGYGTGKEIYDNGYYEGEFYNGKRHGQGTYVWTTGSKYTGQWTDGDRTGYGTFTWPDGTTKSGNWKDGQFIEQ
ncbi:MAG: hypothetical protein IJA47_01025 [Oscillospiraceae bacterium]|nr:hypothetical protein [Oscillospiraceae bacterium]